MSVALTNTFTVSDSVSSFLPLRTDATFFLTCLFVLIHESRLEAMTYDLVEAIRG